MLSVIVSNLVYVLLVFIIIDVITGIIKALKNHSLKSAILRHGGYKKSLIIVIVLMSKILDKTFFDSDILYTSTSIYYIVNECVSICENLTQMGVKIPAKIKNTLDTLNDDKKDEDLKDE